MLPLPQPNSLLRLRMELQRRLYFVFAWAVEGYPAFSDVCATELGVLHQIKCSMIALFIFHIGCSAKAFQYFPEPSQFKSLGSNRPHFISLK